ncbi:Orotidine 5'-phosphate decarboxylase domain-containing protein [Phlyctochytrium arcticum]|nr:Orotidine 5'-phosphate decarboxylase domain-containing protein [Phlyctochytrium arcticum]
MAQPHKQSYSSRALNFTNTTARALLHLMDTKQTNLSIAADVTTKAELLRLADLLGPYICVFKTHIDIIDDFDQDLVEQLKELGRKHNFLIFEDRKFADIGNTVKFQYSSGVYKIASWSDITNAHPIPGEGIIKGLKEVGLPLNRALLLLAEMSSAGSLATGSYSEEAVRMAHKNRDFVVGFIGQRRLEVAGASDVSNTDFLYLTPGVSMAQPGDSLGQQYRSPEQVILESECDVIIVGRGIYTAPDPVAEAKRYREAGWNAYLKRIGKA